MDLNLHKVLSLYQTPSKFYIHPFDVDEVLVIDRHTCEITPHKSIPVNFLPNNDTLSLIHGIIGIKHLLSGPYLIVITEATHIGYIDGKQIYRMDSAEMIPFSSSNVTIKDKGWNDHYVSMMESMLKMPSFYFSYSYDLTNSMQRLNNQQLVAIDPANRIYHNYDKRFLWNDHLMKDFDVCGEFADRYRLPLIVGFVRINSIALGYGTSFILISRRSIHRAGTRFNRRGIDHDGHVANFVETEQIFGEKSMKASFVQVRGSIPLYWSQQVNYKYKPDIVIDHNQDHDTPLRKHLKELTDVYGNLAIVNLIDQKGHEAHLEQEFRQRMDQVANQAGPYFSKNIPYIYFDFHKECSKMRWHRLSILMERIVNWIDHQGYFTICDKKVVTQQMGVIRSNCIDSLDRTNVVQSMIAQRVLEKQLEYFRLIPNNAKLSQYGDILSIFKNTWADNADTLSIQYAGTPALKTDFTRTGQRTNLGLIKDGLNSLTRYVSNNFFDFYRQDAFDLFLGNFEGYPSPLYRPMDLVAYTSTLPVTIVVLTLVALYIYFRY